MQPRQRVHHGQFREPQRDGLVHVAEAQRAGRHELPQQRNDRGRPWVCAAAADVYERRSTEC